MKVLLCHNHYRSSAPSGEDAVFQNEFALLEKRGVDVIPFERFNDDIDDSTFSNRARLAAATIWSSRSYKDIYEVIQRTRPDIAHFHNTFPLISPSAYIACQKASVPVVQTLHNYRLVCPGALLLRDGHPCEDCLGNTLIPALRYRCYRGSLSATGALVGMLTFHRLLHTYQNSITRYIALTQFSASRMILGGLPEKTIDIKPNFLPDPPATGPGNGGYAVFVGRLSKEKGAHTLLDAWKHIKSLKLKILGDGPLRTELEEQASQQRINVEFLGSQSRTEVLDIIRYADLQIIPSEWYEGFPMVALEGYACGTPILASRIGSLEEIVIDGETGVTFNPGDENDLANKVNKLMENRLQLTSLRNTTRSHFDKYYTEDRNFKIIMAIYNHAIRASCKTR